jgi:recombination protein RecT
MSTEIINPAEVANLKDQPPAKAKETPFGAIVKKLDSKQDQFALIIPAGIDHQRLRYVAIEAIKRNPDLLKCAPDSVVNAIVQAFELGLEVNSAKKEAYLIPYGAECKFEPSYIGLVTLAKRSGMVSDVYAEVVRENDDFKVSQGTDRYIRHEPNYLQPGEVIAAYAVAKLPSGGHDFEVMTRADIDQIEATSKTTKEDAPWRKWFPEMAKKAVIRRLSKRLPKDDRYARAVEISDQNAAIEATYSAIESKTQSNAAALKQRLALIGENNAS